MTTPLQTLIDELERKSYAIDNDSDRAEAFDLGLQFAITRAKQLLEVQKQMLINASVWGESEGFQECGVKPTVNHLVKMREKATLQYHLTFKND